MTALFVWFSWPVLHFRRQSRTISLQEGSGNENCAQTAREIQRCACENPNTMYSRYQSPCFWSSVITPFCRNMNSCDIPESLASAISKALFIMWLWIYENHICDLRINEWLCEWPSKQWTLLKRQWKKGLKKFGLVRELTYDPAIPV